ncbi:MAG: polyphosphate kinase 2 family protein [Chloroflexi bacterium]|nr:polyphosphate kinase 2 family protein [Chloroflexota bacterium]
MNQYCIQPDTLVDLSEWDPNDRSAFDGSKDEGDERQAELRDRLDALQELLYAEHKHKILIVLQAMDTGGKDGTIRKVFEGVNPQGVRVQPFKAPTAHELDHDYLWRIHPYAPGKGEMVIFNRSHYEDVLIVRVHELVPASVWKQRYDQINNFERMLVEEGTTILKFYLHIDRDEQKQRLQARLDDPSKHWKFSTNDVQERKLWDEYMAAYQEMLGKTSTEWAPWYVVPANHKWYRNLVVASVIVDALEGLRMNYPAPQPGLDQIVIA